MWPEIHSKFLNVYTLETAEVFYLPASVQEILVCRTQIINSSMVPVGLMFEEARNEEMKRFQEYHTRKTSLQHCERFIEQPVNIFRFCYFRFKEIVLKMQNSPVE
jgi:hypothetical protein